MEQRLRRRVVLLMGPTAAGKSDTAMRVASSGRFEIVSVDSAMVYRGMDIGTAKPTLSEQAQVTHHFIDIRDPSEFYSVGDFLRDIPAALERIWALGKEPLLVGGTMMYFHALRKGIAPLPERSGEIRRQIDERAKRGGWDQLHHDLAQVDPDAARRISPGDTQRIQRALEVYALTGKALSTLQAEVRPALEDVELIEFVVSPAERAALHHRIGNRLSQMLSNGFIAEVEALFSRGDLTPVHASMRAVGYRQLWQHVAGQIPLSTAIDNALAATRQLAKRQLTWLRKLDRAHWLTDGTPAENAAVIFSRLGEKN